MKHAVNLLHWLHYGLLLLATELMPVSTSLDDLREKCRDERIGLPSCSFNLGTTCSWKEVGKDNTDAWMLTSGADDGPVTGSDGAYIYLNHTRSNERAIKLEGAIDPGVKAMCVDFNYATSGPVYDPIRFLLWDGKSYQLIQEIYPNTEDPNIYTQWHSSNFMCCLPQTESGDNNMLTLEAISVKGATVAIDHIDTRVSDMTCSENSLVCYPKLPTEEPAHAEATTHTTDDPAHAEATTHTGGVAAPELPDTITTTAKSQPTTRTTTQELVDTPTLAVAAYEPTCAGAEETRLGSCYFADSQTDLCGWQTSPESQLIPADSSQDNYIFFPAGRKEEFYHDIDPDVESICMDIRFSADDVVRIGCVPLFRIYVQNEIDGELWGENYDHCSLREDEWRENTFQGCLGVGPGRQIMLQTGGRVGLKIEHIRTRQLEANCSVSKTTERIGTEMALTNPPATSSTQTMSTIGGFNTPVLTKPPSASTTETMPTTGVSNIPVLNKAPSASPIQTMPTSRDSKTAVLLSCQPTVSASSDFCGFTPSPVRQDENEVYWQEIHFQSEQGAFSGKDRYMLVSGKSETLQEPATLRSGVVTTIYTSTLTFSYNMIGNVWLHINLQPESGRPASLVWSSNKETNLNWQDVAVPINTAGRYDIIFKVFSHYVMVDSGESIRVGLADISLEESDGFPDTTTTEPEITNITSEGTSGKGRKYIVTKSKGKSKTAALESFLGSYGFNILALVATGFGTLTLFALIGVGIWLFKTRNQNYDRLVHNYHVNGQGRPQPVALGRLEGGLKS